MRWLCLFFVVACGPTENQTINIAPTSGAEPIKIKKKYGPMKCTKMGIDLNGICRGKDMDCAFKINNDLTGGTITECEVK